MDCVRWLVIVGIYGLLTVSFELGQKVDVRSGFSRGSRLFVCGYIIDSNEDFYMSLPHMSTQLMR